MKKSILLILAYSWSCFAIDMQTLQSSATENIRELAKITSKISCVTKSNPPSDPPDVSGLEAIDVTFQDGTKSRVIPLKIGMRACTKSLPGSCNQTLTMLYQTQGADGKRNVVVATREILSMTDSENYDWKSPAGKTYGIKNFNRVDAENFFAGTSPYSKCNLSSLVKNDPSVSPLLQAASPTPALGSDSHGPALLPDEGYDFTKDASQ